MSHPSFHDASFTSSVLSHYILSHCGGGGFKIEIEMEAFSSMMDVRCEMVGLRWVRS